MFSSKTPRTWGGSLYLHMNPSSTVTSGRELFGMDSEAQKVVNRLHTPARLLWHIISDPFVKFVIIWNKWRHSFRAQCAHWHGKECFPPIIQKFNAECDPACEYLTAVLAPLICIPLTLSASFCFSLTPTFFLSQRASLRVVRFLEFPSGGCSSIKAKSMNISLSVSFLLVITSFLVRKTFEMKPEKKLYTLNLISSSCRVRRNKPPWLEYAPEGWTL